MLPGRNILSFWRLSVAQLHLHLLPTKICKRLQAEKPNTTDASVRPQCLIQVKMHHLEAWLSLSELYERMKQLKSGHVLPALALFSDLFWSIHFKNSIVYLQERKFISQTGFNLDIGSWRENAASFVQPAIIIFTRFLLLISEQRP